MIRTRFGVLAAALAAGVTLLTGCTSGGTSGSPQHGASSAAQNGTVSYTAGTAKENNAPANTGDFFNGPSDSPAAMKWVQLSAGAAGGLNPVVLNGAGFTLYRFDKDTANPSKSNCDGACATTWPPVLVQPGSRIFLDGVSKSQVGVVKRDDGSLQVTIGGWPVYRFSKDTAPGQTNGEGVGGTWFAVSPLGGKILPPSGDTGGASPAPSAAAPSSAPSGGSSAALGNGSVVLDSGKDFSEPNGSEGVSGPGCQNVSQPDLASSLDLSGGPVKIWSQPNCTGASALVTSSVADLSTIGFDKKIASIRFGG
jgi:predicted lipoprotein with Yx(FWY)xxD motif